VHKIITTYEFMSSMFCLKNSFFIDFSTNIKDIRNMDAQKLPLAKRIKELRVQAGWKQVDLAEKTGIDRNMISYYENGKYLPSADALLKIAEIFDVSIDYLLIEDMQKKPLRQSFDPEMLKYINDINRLDDKDRDMVKHMINSLIIKNKVKDLVGKAS